MPGMAYIGLQDADKIAVFSIDEACKLAKQARCRQPAAPR
jgi:hypothetical protein